MYMINTAFHVTKHALQYNSKSTIQPYSEQGRSGIIKSTEYIELYGQEEPSSSQAKVGFQNSTKLGKKKSPAVNEIGTVEVQLCRVLFEIVQDSWSLSHQF
ncbi:hypothetical protein RRG08_055864 [Elysia crispata]|uniref:Uncharacterized protein n=1 Tax=Elysia crispata TaxID=231223 RepID=A0AAE1DNI3_9GAST|nr:hypothetical protein RRG08_055864 [Elysia crispata]